MSCRLTLKQLISILAAHPLHVSNAALNSLASGVTTDSRNLQTGAVFVALRGGTFDGHAFVETAIRDGAIAAVIDCNPNELNADSSHLPLLRVENTLTAYQAIARWWRHQFEIPIIAVTGSVGKTTTKELIAAVLSKHGCVLKSQANYNNEIGVPKTLLNLDAEHDYAVIEMGMRAQGEIALLAQIARPDIAVITNVGTAHIGRLGSEQAIADAKCELLAELSSQGTAILNADNFRLLKTAQQVWQGRTVTYGLSGGDIRGHFKEANRLLVETMEFSMPLSGRHHALNFLAALAVARELGIDWSLLSKGLSVDLPPGRARRYDLPNDVVILDETYNAGLESMMAALHLLAELPGQRHIAVLGTMKELGERSPEFHQRVGREVFRLNVDRLLILADPDESDALAIGASSVPTEQFSSHADVVKRLTDLVQPGDRLLFKASRSVGLDQVVDQLCTQLSGLLTYPDS
ncbi:MAG: UDP-N-acetylmuramoyl-tripeptide--D-alanyl-D-alanine ligase [Elainellaceae cyanobacterium]